MFGLQEKGNVIYKKIQESKDFTAEEKAILIQALADAENYRAHVNQDDELFYGD